MSRHRFIKNLDLDDELDDFEGEEDNDADYDPNEDPQMRESLAQARTVLESDFTDREIQESLWHTYYDVDKTVDYLLNQKIKAKTKASTATPKTKKQAGHRGASETRKSLSGPPSTVLTAQSKIFLLDDMRPGGTRGFFADSPWLNVPPERQGHISVEPLHPGGGLLGGSSKEVPKTSKLAAVAAARKKKASEPSTGTPKSSNNPVALLDKLGKSKTNDFKSAGASVENVAVDAQRTPSVFRLRKQPPKQNIQEPEHKEEPGSSEPSSPVEKPQEESRATIAAPSSFATTMLGPSRTDTSASALSAFYNPFQLNCDMSEANSDPFAGPSPDDVVANAQSASKGLKPKGPTKGSEVNPTGVESVTNGLSKSTIADSPRPPKSKNLDVVAEYEKSEKKSTANFVVVGHVDAGKSTLMGRLLWDLKVVDQRTVDKYRREAEKIGKSSFALAWVLDQNSDERDHGVTIDIAMNKFETEKTAFTILDAPGHKDFVPNMIAGASQADFAILVVDASTGSFESGLKGQTKEHALLIRSMGVQRMIVAVNKLDTVAWSKDRFDEISQQTSAFLTAAGFQPKNISFVPCSGLNGDNITSKSNACTWYDGPTLLSLLESSESRAQKQMLNGPLRLPISQVFNAGTQHPLSVAGRISSGSVQVGDKVTTVPSGQIGYVKALAVDDEPAEWAVGGQNVTLHLSSDMEAAHIKGGDVVCPADAPIQLRKMFTLKALAFEHLTPMFCNVVAGRLDASARVTKLLAILDKSTGKVIQSKGGKRPRIVKPGEVARVEVTAEADGGLPLEEGARIVLRAEGETVATGLLERF